MSSVERFNPASNTGVNAPATWQVGVNDDGHNISQYYYTEISATPELQRKVSRKLNMK